MLSQEQTYSLHPKESQSDIANSTVVLMTVLAFLIRQVGKFFLPPNLPNAVVLMISGKRRERQVPPHSPKVENSYETFRKPK